MVLPQDSDFGQCPCGGDYELRPVEVRMTVDGQAIRLVDVPQGRCPSCESRVYKTVLLEGLEALMRGQTAAGPRALL
jgi:hypothetical protein